MVLETRKIQGKYRDLGAETDGLSAIECSAGTKLKVNYIKTTITVLLSTH